MMGKIIQEQNPFYFFHVVWNIPNINILILIDIPKSYNGLKKLNADDLKQIFLGNMPSSNQFYFLPTLCHIDYVHFIKLANHNIQLNDTAIIIREKTV